MEFQYQPERIFATDSAGRLIAEVTFPTADGIATIDHTFVHDSLRGQGVAGQLLCAAEAHIRAAGLRVNPTCAYAVKWFSAHPEKTDLLTKSCP